MINEHGFSTRRARDRQARELRNYGCKVRVSARKRGPYRFRLKVSSCGDVGHWGRRGR